MPTELFTAYGDSLGLYLYDNASIKYFRPKHLPYGLLALAIMTVFIILPTCRLILYPLDYCLKCLKWSKLKGRALDELYVLFISTTKTEVMGRWIADGLQLSTC